MAKLEGMQRLPGTYALILQVECRQDIQVGRLGQLSARPDFYVYIGSAFGPGEVRAPVRHHVKISERPH